MMMYRRITTRNSSLRRNLYSKSQAFTIVELLVVIVVIGILAAIVIVSYTGIRQRAIVSSLQSDLSNVATQLKFYQVTNDSYPTSNDCSSGPNPAPPKICLKASPGSTYIEFVIDNTTPQTFCVTEENDGIDYKVTHGVGPVAGRCNPVSYTLTTVAGSGGTVSAGGTYTTGSTPTITATPNAGYSFSSWSGGTGCIGAASHTVTIDADKICTANFVVSLYYYNKYNTVSTPVYELSWTYSTRSSLKFRNCYLTYMFDPATGSLGFYTPWSDYDYDVNVGSVCYGGSTQVKFVALQSGHAIDPLEVDEYNHVITLSSYSYSQGTLVASNIVAADGTYPANGKHTDGYWYVKGAKAN